MSFTPASLAEADQALAAAGRELDVWIATIRGCQQAHGSSQGLANAWALLMGLHPPGQRDNLLVAALYRLAADEPGDLALIPREDTP